MKRKPRILIGTSGWAYKDWSKRFFPKDLPAAKHLTFLAERFPTVEVNASFYRLQPRSTYEGWHRKTPDGYVFSIKVSRYITHIKRMKAGSRMAWRRQMKPAEALGNKLGVWLFQFPPSFRSTPDTRKRVAEFLEKARKDKTQQRFAFEMRHPTCFEKEFLELLERFNVCLVHADSSRFPHSPEGFAPADFVYIRLHGPRKLYASPYRQDELESWAKLARRHYRRGKDVFMYFDNDVRGYALGNAKTMREILRA